MIRDIDSFKTLEEIVTSYIKYKHTPKLVLIDGVEALYTDYIIKPNA